MGEGLNAQVFNTELLETFTQSLGWGLLSFPDLSSGILGGLNSVLLSLSLIFGLIILGIFIIMKVSPNLGGSLSRLPGGGAITTLKGKTWKEFFLQFLIISMIVYSCLGLFSGTGKYAVGSDIQSFFTGGDGTLGTDGMVTVTIRPLEGIRFTGVRYNSDGTEDNKSINGRTYGVGNELSPIKEGTNPRCNYSSSTNQLSDGDKNTNIWEGCVYPQKKQGMLIVDSFSVQGNVDEGNPVNIFLTNDFDGVELRNMGNSGNGNFNSIRSINEQNSNHGIISVLRNTTKLTRELGNNEIFLSLIGSLYKEVESQFKIGLEQSDIKHKSKDIYQMKNDLLFFYESLLTIKRDIIEGKSKLEILSKLKNLGNSNLTIVGYNSFELINVNNHVSLFDYIQGTNTNIFGGVTMDGDMNEINEKVNSGQKIGLDSFIIGSQSWGLTQSVNGYDNSYTTLNDTFYNWFDKYNEKYGIKTTNIKDIEKNIENGNNEIALLGIESLLGIGKNSSNFHKQFSGLVDTYYGAILVNSVNDFWSLGGGISKELSEHLSMRMGILTKSINILFSGKNYSLKGYFPIISETILVNQDLRTILDNELRVNLENDLNRQTNNFFKELSNSLNSRNFNTSSHEPNQLRDIFLKSYQSIDGYMTMLIENDNFNKNKIDDSSSPLFVQLNSGFINQFSNTKDIRIKKYGLMKEGDKYEDIVNVPENGNQGEPRYLGVRNNKNTDKNKKEELYGIWDNQGRYEKTQQSFLGSLIGFVLKGEKDVTYVGIKGGAGVEVRKGDIIFASPGTVIFALPYTIELMMSKEQAETIEFIDSMGGTIGFYGDRYDGKKNLIVKGIGKTREVGKLTKGGLYNSILEIIDPSRESINWIFNPTKGFGVVESGFFATFLILLSMILTFLAFVFFIFKNIALYFLTFAFFVIFIWTFALDGQPKRVGKKVLAWFVSLALIPLYGYILMFILWKLFGTDKSFLYELRNFSTLWSILICLAIAYIPIAIFFGTRKLIHSIIVDGKFDTSTLTVGNFLGAGMIMSEERGRAIDNAIKRKFNIGKEKAKELGRKGIDKAKGGFGISTAGNIGDGRNDTSNNEMLAELTDNNREAKEFDIKDIDRSNGNFYSKADFASKSGLGFAGGNFDDVFIDDRDNINIGASKEEIQSIMRGSIIQNNTQLNRDKISGVTPDLINATNVLREGLKSQGATDSDFARILLQMFDQNKELLGNLTKAIQEVKNKSSDPTIKKKLSNSQRTLSARDLNVIKGLKEEKGYKELNQGDIKKELSLIFDKVKRGGFSGDDLDKIKALSSMSTILDNSNKETQFMNITKSIQSTLSDIKRPDSEIERRISEFIMKGDMNGLNQYKMQNSHIQGLNEFINRVQMMPNEMMKVLNSHATAAQMRTNSQGINEFIGLMKNHSELEKMKHQDMNKYLSTMMQIQQFRNSSIEEKMNMASIQSVGSIQSIKEAQKVTTMLSNEMTKLIQSQGSMSQQSVTNIVTNIAGTTDISIRDQRDLANKLKDNLNKIREVNR